MEITSIQKIYEKFDKIGCLSFTTIDEKNQPISRIAHLRGWDEDGIYFQTMFTKSFYNHLKANGKLALCGMHAASTEVEHDENGLPVFEPGYAIRMTGNVTEVSIEDLKAKNNPMFEICIKDFEKYPAMVTFCITSGNGDIFDYDFELNTRENKVERIYISYNGAKLKYSGLIIDKDVCIGCGICETKCSFKAITSDENNKYIIDKYRCDECGDCYLNCPVKAINLKE